MFNRALLLHAVFLMLFQHGSHSYIPLVKSKWVKPCALYSGTSDGANQIKKITVQQESSNEIQDVSPVTNKKRQSRSSKVNPAVKDQVDKNISKTSSTKDIKCSNISMELRPSNGDEEVSFDGTTVVNVQSSSISDMSHATKYERRIDPVEDEIIEILRNIIGKESSTPPFRLDEGLYLMSDRGLRTVDAFMKPHDFLIKDVPFIYREGNHAQLRGCLERRKTDGRVSLLCTGAYKGSGKTVQQAINIKEFVDETKGIGIEITYNDDQMELWGKNPKDDLDFANGLALRIFHRILGIHFDNDTAKRKIKRKMTLRNAIRLLEDPLYSALRIAREMLGAPVGTKIMLGVDELKKVPSTHMSHADMLSELCAAMDGDDSLYLTVAAYGCFDIADFVTVSNRALLFQPLGPLMLEVSEEMWTHLPPILQPFFNETMRRSLPFSPDALEQYARLSRLILLTGGHARRISNLYTALKNYTGSLTGKDFVTSLKVYLDVNERELNQTMEKAADSPISFRVLFLGSKLPRVDQMESLATDAACKFTLTDDSQVIANHGPFLHGTVNGYCQYVSDGLPFTEYMCGFAFIPMPVLLKIGDSENWKPCTIALQQLGKALYEYGNVSNSNEKGKSFERVVLSSLLLFARSNDEFHLGDLCHPNHCGERFDGRLQGGPDVELWDDIDVFPRNDTSLNTQIQKLLERLLLSRERNGNVNGALFLPTEKFNLYGDVYGLFRVDNHSYVLLVVQCKDWFLDSLYPKYDIRHRTLQGSLNSVRAKFSDDEFKDGFMELEVKGVKVRMERRVILFCSNEPETDLKLESHSAVITIKDMRRWLPTAAYSCELAHKLRSIFRSMSE